MRKKWADLEITCWAGISIGAEHYYGSLLYYAENLQKIRLEKPMSEKDAAALNKKDRVGFELYQAGDLTERFDTEREVRDFALAEWKKYFPDVEILFCNRGCSADPCEILVAPEPMLTKGNELYAKAKWIGFWDFNEEEMQKISDEWDELVYRRLQ